MPSDTTHRLHNGAHCFRCEACSMYRESGRTFLVYQKSALSDTGVTTTIPYPVSTSLEKQFPEVEDACGFLFYEQEVTVDDGAIRQLYEINADSCFMHMFGIQVLSGSLDFLESEERIALTEHAAKELFGTENPIGKEIKLYGAPKTVCAIVNGWNRHTNLPFSILTGGIRQWHNAWYHGGFHVFIKLHKEVNAEAFQKKLEQTKLETDSKGGMQNLMVMPISKCHYTVLADQNAIQFSYILFFSIVGGLVILCSLINYLSLFVSRLRMRSRELALRKVCGSSDLHLFILLVTEYLLILLAAGLMGMALIELVLSPFKELSGVKEGDIYWESFLYFALVIGCSLATFLPVTFYFNKRTLQSNIQQKTVNRYGYLGRKISIVFQLSISICFIFCISVIMKQLYYLSTTDIGIERKNIATLSIYPQNNLLPAADKIEQFPYVTQVLKGHFSLLPKTASMAMHFKDWDGKQPGDAEIDMEVLMESEELAQFYGIRLLKGKMLKEGERDAGTIVINEAAAKALGWNDPIGKKLIRPNGTGTTVIGLVKDFHTTSPTTPIKPIAFIAKGFSGFDLGKGDVLIKYREGEWPKLKKDIEQLCQKEYPENKISFYSSCILHGNSSNYRCRICSQSRNRFYICLNACPARTVGAGNGKNDRISFHFSFFNSLVYKNEEINDIDGVKIDFADKWVHLRKSNTEPIIRIYSEASTMEAAEEIGQKIMNVINELAK